MKVKIYKTNKERRKVRVRAKIKGTGSRPRLAVFRSNKYIYAQLIDDATGKTIVNLSDYGSKEKDLKKTKVEKAKETGKKLAAESLKKGIKLAVFDRRSYKYHGRVKALAEGAREGGLKF